MTMKEEIQKVLEDERIGNVNRSEAQAAAIVRWLIVEKRTPSREWLDTWRLRAERAYSEMYRKTWPLEDADTSASLRNERVKERGYLLARIDRLLRRIDRKLGGKG